MMPVEKRTPIVANIFGRWLALLFIAKTLLPVNVQQKMPTPSTSAHQAEVIRSRHQIIETKQDPLPEQISGRGSDCPRTQYVAHSPLWTRHRVGVAVWMIRAEFLSERRAASREEFPERAARRSWEEGGEACRNRKGVVAGRRTGRIFQKNEIRKMKICF